MRRLRSGLVLLLVWATVCSAGVAMAQSGVGGDGACLLEQPGMATSGANIFDPQQEEYLGDAFGEYVEARLRLVPPGDNDRLTKIGDRLLAMLPQTELHYRFRMYDAVEVNAFSLSGGRIYVSRKMVAAVKNEDELAGVIAHEIGHIATHQSAIELTRSFKIRLGVTRVGDRADVFARVHEFLRTAPKPAELEDVERKTS